MGISVVCGMKEKRRLRDSKTDSRNRTKSCINELKQKYVM